MGMFPVCRKTVFSVCRRMVFFGIVPKFQRTFLVLSAFGQNVDNRYFSAVYQNTRYRYWSIIGIFGTV